MAPDAAGVDRRPTYAALFAGLLAPRYVVNGLLAPRKISVYFHEFAAFRRSTR
ncbi:hypothetical protein I553_7142 [Mycobacterium xenopi 4042]|uniref:Uncharacterized protein n=1 Tax=Mycobacterium xenopi 4042 TaxID=1299334 RepID=X7Z3H3_MYCXE|nr:hypothetical protein I553_7142 [Mycobacterium xenopi 4042]EUA33962.1 hypothetical protein I552_4743 [Mycobacterium xenopi 3993]